MKLLWENENIDGNSPFSDAAEAIAARISGTKPRLEASSFPTADDGIEGLKFIRACLESSRDNRGWTRV
jgi:hypothetical protein